jgi:hypothetical protein
MINSDRPDADASDVRLCNQLVAAKERLSEHHRGVAPLQLHHTSRHQMFPEQPKLTLGTRHTTNLPQHRFQIFNIFISFNIFNIKFLIFKFFNIFIRARSSQLFNRCTCGRSRALRGGDKFLAVMKILNIRAGTT